MLPASCKAPAVRPGGQGWEGKRKAWERGPGVTSSAPGPSGSGSTLRVSCLFAGLSLWWAPHTHEQCMERSPERLVSEQLHCAMLAGAEPQGQDPPCLVIK